MRRFPAVRIEGGLFAPDMLDQLLAEELPGQKQRDFGLEGRRGLTDEIAAVFADAQAVWGVFQRRLEALPEADRGTTLTRDIWAIPLLSMLGYDLRYNRRAYQVGKVSFAISHRAGEPEDAPPVHIVGARQELGRLAASGRPRLAPHSLVQEFLNRTEALWGLVTNGKVLRLLRDSTYIRRQCYVEFDLSAIFGQQLFQDFAVLFRLLHRSRLPGGSADAHDCLLEEYYQHSVEQGGRVRDHLRDGVEEAIKRLANGFLRHPANAHVWERMGGGRWEAAGEGSLVDPNHAQFARKLYHQLLRLVYRLLFLFVSEDRGLISSNPLYLRHYGVGRLRPLADNRAAYTEHTDIWHGLRVLWRLLGSDARYTQVEKRPLAALLELPVLDGQLFAPLELDDCRISNRDLLGALWFLINYRDSPSAPPRRVNYAALDVEELGSVYESLLDYQPQVRIEGAVPHFFLVAGSERKSTGSYYTPAELVAELIRSALEPVLEERLAEARRLAQRDWERLPSWAQAAFRESMKEASGPPKPGTIEAATGAGQEASEHAGPRRSSEAELPGLWSRMPPAWRRSLLAERALLEIKVLDPACGSGHFLLAATRRLAKELARIRTGEDEPSPEGVREATRSVVTHCIHGVDRNRLAVELCRVALWIESHVPQKPLSFLEHRILCGDSLLGILDLAVLRKGIPDQAFKPVSADDKTIAANLKRQNRKELRGQKTFLQTLDVSSELQRAHPTIRRLDAIREDSPESIRRKKEIYAAYLRSIEGARIACDIWTAAFFQLRNDPHRLSAMITTEALRRSMQGLPLAAQLVGHARALADQHRFFHWPLAFPDVFDPGDSAVEAGLEASGNRQCSDVGQCPLISRRRIPGFDVLLGNPPWKKIELNEKTFFAVRDHAIAHAPKSDVRKRLIQELARTNPQLWQTYVDALFQSEATSRFLRGSGEYPLTGHGRINTYSVFAERMSRLLRPDGRAGMIVPSGIGTDDTNKRFFASLVESDAIVSFYDFENREAMFPSVDSRYKFCLLTIRGRSANESQPSGTRSRCVPAFAFFCTRPAHLRDPRRRFALSSADIARINPNTRTLPVFRTRQDAELTAAIYRNVPVLMNERTGDNPWGISFRQGLFNMSSDSHLFRTAEQLEKDGFQRVGNRFVRARAGDLSRDESGDVWLPLYEAKFIHIVDHRFGSYATRHGTRGYRVLPPTPLEQYEDPGALVQPWYWVSAKEVKERLGDWEGRWLLGFRDVSSATNERTALFSVVPRAGVGHTMPVMIPAHEARTSICALLSGMDSLVLDWVLRQKIGGTHLTFFIVRQLPVLHPKGYSAIELRFIVPRVLELAYTAWDLKPFADDVWRDADEALPALIRRQWGENAAETGGCSFEPPEWVWAYPEITSAYSAGAEAAGGGRIPLPPFKWSEGRRARLRAELDAYLARLYGLNRKQLRYILDPADLTRRELEEILDSREEVADPLDAAGYAERVARSDFPGETFRVLKEREQRLYGEYRTRRLVLEAWERLFGDGS
jgi:hypothetical protein